MPKKGYRQTKEHKRKISQGNKGKKLSKETKEKLSRILKGRLFSKETKNKMKKNHADFSGNKNPMYDVHRYNEKNPMYGKHHTEETKKKISEMCKEKMIGKNNPMYGKHHTEETKKKISEKIKGTNHPRYKGNTYISNGYRFIWTNDRGCIREHRYIMEQFLNRKLRSNEIIHHIDNDKLNNNINNLQIMTQSEHMRLHKIGDDNE